MENVIEFNNVSFSYNSKLVLDSVNILVKEKDLSCIVGPNGGGKTTLLKLILGLEKPNTGRISVFGRSPTQARHKIGYMPQDADLARKFPITVRQIVLTGRLGKRRWIGPYDRADKKSAEDAIETAGLAGLENRDYFSLSGGRRRKVLLARALCSQPQMLILDEPTANLDPESENDFYKLIELLGEKLTVVFVSHDVGYVSSFIKTAICVNKKVVVHPTGEMPSETWQDPFIGEKRMVLHGSQCTGGDEK